MSKNAKGILGQQVGKVGPVVARLFRGMNVYTAYQPVVANPKTEGQTIHRMIFKAISVLAHGFGCGARIGFLTFAKGTKLSPRNWFQKTNFGAVTASGTNILNIDFTSMKVARGGLYGAAFDVLDFDTPSVVSVEFSRDNAPACQCTANDKVYLYVYAPDLNTGILSQAVATTASTVTVNVPTAWNGLKVHAWGFVRNEGQADEEKGIAAGECSDSVYLGTGNIG